MKAIWRFLISHKTCAWTGLAFCLAGAAGSVSLELHPGLFADMDAQVFSKWFADKGWIAPASTLWLYGLLLATSLLAANAACCTVERLVQIFRGKTALRRLLPHIMHAAFLGVVLSHLVSSVYGDRVAGVAVPRGGFSPVGATGMILSLEHMEAVMAPEGYPKDFAATVALFRGTTRVARGVVRANEPLFHEGYGFYIKNFGSTPWGSPFAVFDANRDPGAIPMLVSSILFTIANIFHLLPARRDDG